MPRPLKLAKLPVRERRETLAKFLQRLESDPDLAHFRALVPGGPERQLALFAALERAAIRGVAAVCPPAASDMADQLLCDILDSIERDSDLARHGAYYGADRHKANLQALGAWSGREAAGELFATAFSHLSADAAESLPAPTVNCLPLGQDFSPSGKQFAPQLAEKPAEIATAGGIVCHEESTSGKQVGQTFLSAESGAEDLSGRQECLPHASRVVRRGRPPVLDDLLKGRLLSLMAVGLSFRQAAAQVGVHHQTLLNTLKRDEEFAQQVAEARLDAISQPLLVVVQAARKNWRAAAWLTKYLNERRASAYETTPEEFEIERKRAK